MLQEGLQSLRVNLLALFVIGALMLACGSALACTSGCVDWTSETAEWIPVTGYSSTFCVYVWNCNPVEVEDVWVCTEQKPILGPEFSSTACVCSSRLFDNAQFVTRIGVIWPYQEIHLHLIRLYTCKPATTRWTSSDGETCYSDYIGGPVYCGSGNDPYEYIIINASSRCL